MNELENTIFKTVKSLASPTSKQNLERLERIKHVLTINKNTPYTETVEDKERFFSDLAVKFNDIKLAPDILPTNNKNLLYFSIFLSDEYIDMLNIALQSIVKNTSNINFDLLLITDEETKEKLLQVNILQSFNTLFYILESPTTAVAASLSKLHIFNYPGINNYSKILYLDSDVFCIKDLNTIFNVNLEPGILYSGRHEFLKYDSLTSPVCSLMYLTDKDAEYIARNHKIIEPFNAGQFIFINSYYMKKHFENIIWMSLNWPGLYFYEQSLMNHYFVFNEISKILKDEDNNSYFGITSKQFTELFLTEEQKENKQKLINTPVVKNATRTLCPSTVDEKNIQLDKIIGSAAKIEININKNTTILHFALNPGKGFYKKTIIENYINANKL